MKKKLTATHRENLSQILERVEVLRQANYRDEKTLLGRCEVRFQNGDMFALHEAVLHCERGALPLPLWLSTALKDFIVDGLTGGLKGMRGRSKSPLGLSAKAFKQELHFRMVERVLEVAEGIAWARQISEMIGREVKSDMGSLPSGIREKLVSMGDGMPLKKLEPTKSAAYEIASLLLRGTFAQAEARTIRSSHKAFSKKIQTAESHIHYAVDVISEIDPETLEAFGLQIELDELEMSAFLAGQDLIEFGDGQLASKRDCEVIPCEKCGGLIEKYVLEKPVSLCSDCTDSSQNGRKMTVIR